MLQILTLLGILKTAPNIVSKPQYHPCDQRHRVWGESSLKGQIELNIACSKINGEPAFSRKYLDGVLVQHFGEKYGN